MSASPLLFNGADAQLDMISNPFGLAGADQWDEAVFENVEEGMSAHHAASPAHARLLEVEDAVFGIKYKGDMLRAAWAAGFDALEVYDDVKVNSNSNSSASSEDAVWGPGPIVVPALPGSIVIPSLFNSALRSPLGQGSPAVWEVPAAEQALTMPPAVVTLPSVVKQEKLDPTPTPQQQPQQQKRKRGRKSKAEMAALPPKMPPRGEVYDRDFRARMVQLYRERRTRRFKNRAKYDVRRRFAVTRVRVGGRFVSKTAEAQLRHEVAVAQVQQAEAEAEVVQSSSSPSPSSAEDEMDVENSCRSTPPEFFSPVVEHHGQLNVGPSGHGSMDSFPL